jgi:hypothetical protein
MNSTPGWRKFLCPSILATCVLFFCLWLLDFPKPESDDLFYAGAGLNLGSGGDLSNSLLARQEFPSHFFFIYPPLHSYALGGWLKLFGISSASVTGYSIVNCALIAIFTIVILRQRGASVWLEWLVPLGVMFAFLPLGLRTEPVAVALLMAGVALAGAGLSRRHAWAQFAAFLLIFLGASAAPRVTVFAGALALYLGYDAWSKAAGARLRRAIVARWLGAFLTASLVFLCMIGFRFAEFWRNFHYFASGRIYGDRLSMVIGYLASYLGYLQCLLVLFPLVMLVWIIRKPKDDLSRPALFLAGALPLAIWSGGIGSATSWWAFLIMVLLAASLLKTASPGHGFALQLAIALMLLVINRKILVQGWGVLSGNIEKDRGGQLNTVLSLQPTAEHPILLDGWVARYVYDYRLPRGALDLVSGTRFPGFSPGTYRLPESYGPQIRPGDIYVVGNYMVANLERYTYLEHESSPTWTAFGLRALSFDKYPAWVYIIPAENCKAVRLDRAAPMPRSE